LQSKPIGATNPPVFRLQGSLSSSSKAMGARVVALTSSEAKIERVRALGADHAINYRRAPDWADAVREVTGGHGIDIAVETAGSTLSQALKSMAFGGFVGVVGFLGGLKFNCQSCR
jgi:NADPH:quinone reductase-like Zn-dependent oxidoreductase